MTQLTDKYIRFGNSAREYTEVFVVSIATIHLIVWIFVKVFQVEESIFNYLVILLFIVLASLLLSIKLSRRISNYRARTSSRNPHILIEKCEIGMIFRKDGLVDYKVNMRILSKSHETRDMIESFSWPKQYRKLVKILETEGGVCQLLEAVDSPYQKMAFNFLRPLSKNKYYDVGYSLRFDNKLGLIGKFNSSTMDYKPEKELIFTIRTISGTAPKFFGCEFLSHGSSSPFDRKSVECRSQDGEHFATWCVPKPNHRHKYCLEFDH